MSVVVSVVRSAMSAVTGSLTRSVRPAAPVWSDTEDGAVMAPASMRAGPVTALPIAEATAAVVWRATVADVCLAVRSSAGVASGPAARDGTQTAQGRTIIELCAWPRSVAGVAALMSVPLGVARVLVGDLATDGSVVVHPTAGVAPDLEFMRRVLVGLRLL